MTESQPSFEISYDMCNTKATLDSVEEVLEYIESVEEITDDRDDFFQAVYIKNPEGVYLEVDLAKTHWAFRIDRGAENDDFDESYSLGDNSASGYINIVDPSPSTLSRKSLVPRQQGVQVVIEWLEGAAFPPSVEWTDVLPDG